MNKFIVKNLLKLHSFCYNWAGYFAKRVEKGVHPKHRLMNYHKFFVNNIKSGDYVLDIGCGKGELTFDIAKKAKKVIGIDINPEKIKIAKEKFSEDNIEYLTKNIEKDLVGQKFDVIVLSNVLEHIEDRVEFLKKIKSLAPEILIMVPMINRDWITLYKKELGLNWKLHNGHFIEYTLESFRKEITQAGFSIQNYIVNFGEIWATVK